MAEGAGFRVGSDRVGSSNLKISGPKVSYNP